MRNISHELNSLSLVRTGRSELGHILVLYFFTLLYQLRMTTRGVLQASFRRPVIDRGTNGENFQMDE